MLRGGIRLEVSSWGKIDVGREWVRIEVASWGKGGGQEVVKRGRMFAEAEAVSTHNILEQIYPQLSAVNVMKVTQTLKALTFQNKLFLFMNLI